MVDLGHWATIRPFLREALLPAYAQGEDRIRLGAYDIYEAIYWTAPEAYQITMRGQESQPIFVPSGRQIVDIAQQYMAPGLSVIEDPEFGSDGERADAKLFFSEFAKRERFYSKFSSAKLYGLMRGDWVWHVFADPAKPEGSRVSIYPIHPGTYFPEFLDDGITIIAVNLVEPTLDAKGDPAVNVLRYEKATSDSGPSEIIVSDIQYKADAWGQPGTDMPLEINVVNEEEFVLPDQITAIPVYHVQNLYDTTVPWGSSEMRGIERLMRGINQAITDEEVALTLEGIGVYVTDAGTPIDEDSGDETAWEIAPGRVIERPIGTTFERVQGIQSLEPYVQHLAYLHRQIDETAGANDITKGSFEVTVAESGIALALKMAPLLSRMTEKEISVTDVTTQMLYDLRNWFSVYEPLDLEAIRWVPRYSEKLPVNKARSFDQVMSMYGAKPPIISGAEVRRMLTRIGYTFSDEGTLEAEIGEDMMKTAEAEASALTGAIGALGAAEEEVVGGA